MRKVVTAMPPRGYYLAEEVGRLAGVSGLTIGQWARRGYIRSSQGNGPPRVYSFQDAAEAMAVHLLIERGHNLQAIKNAIRSLREVYGEDWPLQNAKLQVPKASGGKPQTIAHRRGSHLVDIGGPIVGQFTFEMADLEQISFDLRRGGWAARQRPDLRSIEVDPDRLSGRPAIRGTRLAVEDVVTLAASESGLRELKTEFRLTDRQIHDAQAWWGTVQGYERAA